MTDDIPMPWKPRTRQKEGERTERKIVKDKGGRVHPRSGAGSIKHDGSTEDQLIEVKDAARSHTLSGQYLSDLFTTAVRQGKEPLYIVTFKDADLVVECTIRKGTARP